jgi:hypothetical protein
MNCYRYFGLTVRAAASPDNRVAFINGFVTCLHQQQFVDAPATICLEVKLSDEI